ncbi:MAG TPA: hypothetical protein VGA37_10205 [Gemmatimonadales bacterium]
MKPIAAVLALLSLTAILAARPSPQAFDHERHARLFPSCDQCHAGATTAGAALLPSPAQCAVCHNDQIRPRVDWAPPAEPRAGNLRFTHDAHPKLPCAMCHNTAGAERMQVQRTVITSCLGCHAGGAAHLEAPDAVCGTCHVPLARADRLQEEDIAGLPKPPSHDSAGWPTGAHGATAWDEANQTVATSCATCHARNFCATCHVDAPEQPAIQALEADPRSLVLHAELVPPASHAEGSFIGAHGAMSRPGGIACRTCHAQESCRTCHTGLPGITDSLAVRGDGRAAGAQTRRRAPANHTPEWKERHGVEAAARPETCATCHVRQDCLDCHRPSAAAAAGYHQPLFLARHPAAAYARQSDCSDCHNAGQFCATCHQAAGLVATDVLGAAYHDAKRVFIFGHGEAARQSLESCVSCHTERDCLLCHSVVRGRGFNPHGPGFDADRLRRKNAQMCTVCHGAAIPRGN